MRAQTPGRGVRYGAREPHQSAAPNVAFYPFILMIAITLAAANTRAGKLLGAAEACDARQLPIACGVRIGHLREVDPIAVARSARGEMRRDAT